MISFRSGSCVAFFAALAAVVAAVALTSPPARAENAARPGKLIEEMPTLKCLGVRWMIGGDDNHDAKVAVEYRKAGAAAWKRGLDLFRVETRAIREPNRPAAGETMYAGSIFDLDENTEYEVRLLLADPDGGNAQQIVKMKTWSEPQLPTGGRTIDVQPGGLEQAIRNAKPGDILRLHKGVYKGPVAPRSGEPGKPIALVGAGDGEAIIEGSGGSVAVSQSGLHDAIFENLTVRNAQYGIAVNEGARITVRRCRIADVDYGFTATRNGQRQQRIYIADNVITGRSTWPRTQGIEGRRGVQVAGTGHVVCYNRISGFADAIDTFSVYPCAAIDFYGNEISECTDDGIEMDYSEHNTRCFDNRLTNVFQGISLQPVHGGPVYVFRNALLNVGAATFKLHNAPSGAVLYHNTSVKTGIPLTLQTHETASNCTSRNNLFIGTTANYAYENSAPMRECDFDCDGFGGEWKMFLKWNGQRYASIEDARKSAPVYRRAVRVNPAGLFRSRLKPPADVAKQLPVEANDLRLSAKNEAIDAGVVLPNINDDFRGKSPDLGAYEAGRDLPHYGPRSETPMRRPR
jgi:hypothetical protein